MQKFYLIVFLVEVSSVDELVDRLRKGKFRSFEEIKAQSTSLLTDEGLCVNVFFNAVNANNDEDDDIVAGKQKMTLKCPVSLYRSLGWITGSFDTAKLHSHQDSLPVR